MIIVSKPVSLQDLKKSKEIQVKVDGVTQTSFKFRNYSTVIDSISESYDLDISNTIFRGMTCYFLYRNGSFVLHDGTKLIEIIIPKTFTGDGELLLALCYVDPVLIYSSATRIRNPGTYFYQLSVFDSNADEESMRDEVLMAKLSDNMSGLFLSELDYPNFIREAKYAIPAITNRLEHLKSEDV